MSLLGGWKTKITSTMRSNSRMNALLNDPMNLMTLSKKKNLIRLKEALAETASESGQPEEDSSILSGPKVKYTTDQIHKILEETIHEQINEEQFFRTYNPQISSKFCQILSREMHRRIKLANPNSRFRVVCFVTIIEKIGQASSYKMLFCLDPNYDNFATFIHEEATFYIVATAFVIYKD